MGEVVVAMKGNQPYDTKPGNFPYCKTHNRLYIQALALWLSEAYPIVKTKMSDN